MCDSLHRAVFYPNSSCTDAQTQHEPRTEPTPISWSRAPLVLDPDPFLSSDLLKLRVKPRPDGSMSASDSQTETDTEGEKNTIKSSGLQPQTLES